MATNKKTFKQVKKRTVSDSSIETEHIIGPVLQVTAEWSNDHEFLSPNEIYKNAIGLLFCLIKKRLINSSFTNLYHRSLKITWMDLLKRERRKLKSNINSVAKCFMINRLIAECSKDPCKFAQQTGELYEEIKMRMSSAEPTLWRLDDFYNQIRIWRNLQCERRLFHIIYDESYKLHSLLSLQKIATVLCTQFLNSCKINPSLENYNNLQQLLQHSFIIVAQPSVPECVAATKYEKLNNTYLAKLYTRIICLLDPDIIEKYFTFFNVAVKLYPLDQDVDTSGEEQIALEWHKRNIIDAEETLKSFFYIELQSIKLKKLDERNSRPLYSAKLCRLQFQLKITINQFNIEENITLYSRLFGLCSHAQYYPEFVAKVLLYEVSQMAQYTGSIIQPNVLTNYICLYYTRISGVETKHHTSQHIANLLQITYENKKNYANVNSFGIYEEILAKIISQMELFIDYPFLSLIYHDGLFLGICDSILDQHLYGTRQNPHILLRFNSLLNHQPIHHASVRFIVHNGQLTRATFHQKAFVDEMCRMICESNSSEAMNIQVLFESSNKNFHQFSFYFDDELYRLNIAASPIKDAYQPLIPILWNTMRVNTDEQSRQIEQQLSSPLLDLDFMAVDSSISSKNQIQIDLSSVTMSTNSSETSNEKVIIETDMLVQHLVEKLADLLIKSPNENIPSTSVNITTASELLSTLTDGNVQQQKQLLSYLLHDYFQSKTYVDAATQTSTSTSNYLSDRFADNT